MTPIIDPRLIYLIGLIDRASQIICVGCALLCVAIVICGFIYFISYDAGWYNPNEGRELRKNLPIRAMVIALVVCAFLMLLLPEKEDMTAMLIAKYATAENMGAVIEAIKNAAQEISSMK